MINQKFEYHDLSLPDSGAGNKYYSYPNIDLWNPESWVDRYTSICKLAYWIGTKNHETIRTRAGTGPYIGRTDGVYDSKTCSVTYVDVVKHWSDNGLFFKATEMGGVCWIAMVPHAVRNGNAKPSRVLLVLHDADYKDPNWVMNTLDFYRSYNEMAAREGSVVVYVTSDGPDKDNLFIGIMQELAVIFRLKMDRIQIDLSTLVHTGMRLSEIPGFQYKDANGQVVSDPDSCVEQIGGIPVLDITDRWQNQVSLTYSFSTSDKNSHPAFDLQRHIHSACGRKMADGMWLEHTFRTGDDPELIAYWDRKGLRYEGHDHNGEQWITLTPLCAFDNGAKKLPVILVLQEVTHINKFQPVSALSCYLEYCDLAAQGEFMLIFFAMESADDNDQFMDILQDAAGIYPIDLRRVYLTGHSHNGYFASEFMRRHPNALAAVATLGNSNGLMPPEHTHSLVKVTDEMIDLMSRYDVPLISINAQAESEFNNYPVDSEDYRIAAYSWQRRLKAFNCPMKTYEEIAACKTSPDYITRMIGVPNDANQIQYRYGVECYIADVRNNAGKMHLRLVILENLPHMTTPQMPELTWDFFRRFARDLESGVVIERY